MSRDDMKFDVRLLKYRYRRSELTTKDVEKHLASLPDEAAEAQPTSTTFAAVFEERNYRH